MRLIDIDNITALDIMHNVICDKEVAHKMLDFLQSQPTIQGIDKKEVIEKMTDIIVKRECKSCGCEFCGSAIVYGTVEESCEEYLVYRKLAESFYDAFAASIINQQPTSDVPDTNVGDIPQSYKDRVEHVIKVLEFCKQRHIDIVTDLPHTAEIERGTISAYSMALKVVRECLQQPTTDGWIPVSSGERPKNDEYYIITTNDGLVECAYRLNRRWYTEEAICGWYGDNEILAYMPLPQPYKESE